MPIDYESREGFLGFSSSLLRKRLTEVKVVKNGALSLKLSVPCILTIHYKQCCGKAYPSFPNYFLLSRAVLPAL